MARTKKIKTDEVTDKLNIPELSKEERIVLLKKCEKQFQYISYCLTKSSLFVPIGLELNSTEVIFETANEFALKEYTFGYFNPITNAIHINVEDPFFLKKFYELNAKNPGSCSIRQYFANEQNDMDFSAKLLFILFHEVNHKFFDHTKRRKERIATLWNIAADYEIHNMYYIYRQIFDPTENDCGILNSYMKIIDEFLLDGKTFMFDLKYVENIAEEIYQMIINSASNKSEKTTFKLDSDGNISDNNSNSSGSGNNDGDDNGDGDGDSDGDGQSAGTVEVTTTEYTLPNGQKYKAVDVKFNGNKMAKDAQKVAEEQAKNEKNTSLNKALNELTMSQAAKKKGNLSNECMKFLKKIFHIKIDWEKILRNSLQNILEKTDMFGWNSVRTSTFLLNNAPYLPAVVEDEDKYGTLVIARDESGSMSDNDIRKAVSIIIDAKTHYKDIILIKHDTEIVEINKFEEINDEVIKKICERKACGGTSHKEVFEYLRDYKESDQNHPISCFIGITDMYSDIEQYQSLVPTKIPMIWLVPVNDCEAHEATVRGKIIPIE